MAGFRDVDDELVTVVDASAFPAAVLDVLSREVEQRGPSERPVDPARLAAIDWSRRVEQVAEVLVALANGVAP